MGNWDILSIAIQSQLPVIIWGEPGIGKTARIQQLTKKLELHMETIIASTREPSDLVGLPMIDDHAVKLAAPIWAKNIIEKGGGVVFFDELSTAPPSTQASTLRVVNERVVGEVDLPEKTSVIAAANPPECAAGGWDLAAPMANRFLHLYEDSPDFDAWKEWAMGSKGKQHEYENIRVKEDWKKNIRHWLVMVMSFLENGRARNLFQSLPKDTEKQSGPWPSPRSWDMTAQLIAAAESAGLVDRNNLSKSFDFLLSAAYATVGEGAAVEFASFMKKLDLPDPMKVLENPSSWKIPENRSDIVYATISSVLSLCMDDINETKWTKAWKFIEYVVSNSNHKDIALALASPLAHQQKENNFSFPKNLIKHIHVFLKASGI